MPAGAKQNKKLDTVEVGGRLPWLDNVEQHRVCNALPYIKGIRAFELGNPYRIEVIQRVRITT